MLKFKVVSLILLSVFTLFFSSCAQLSYYAASISKEGREEEETSTERKLFNRFLEAREAKLTRLYRLSDAFWENRFGNMVEEVHDVIWPVNGRNTSLFGRRWGRDHDGVDIAAEEGTPIRAAAAGKVVYSGSRIKGYGHMIVLRHGNGLTTVYAHNRMNHVGEEETVEKGQVIGEVGSTGKSTGSHLHFEVRVQGKPTDPMEFFKTFHAKRENQG